MSNIVITYWEGDESIVITYWEGDESKDKPFTKLTYVEWTDGQSSCYAHADPDMIFNYGEKYDPDAEYIKDSRGNLEYREIPEAVREQLALLIAPSLRAKLK